LHSRRPGSRPALLHPGAARRHRPGRGHNRPRPCLPAGARQAGSLGAAHRGAVREQPDRGRPRAAESPATPYAGPEAPPLKAGSWLPVMPSCKTSAAVTTTSPPKFLAATGSASHLTTSRSPS